MARRPPPALRLHIDWTRCDGRGLCTELLPTVLDRDDWGYPLARDGDREPGIPGRWKPMRTRRSACAPGWP